MGIFHAIRGNHTRGAALAAVALLMALAAFRPAAADDSTFEMSLDELLSTPVVSVTRSSGMTLFDAPASLYVINGEDIARSGFLQLPEVLRLSPGLQVSRLDAGSWSISARGFNNRYNRMQLVQMDGRSLYNNLFGGVFWGAQDFPLDDIERIEVIRGPGASLWGANAVNGIISIISKPAKETQGWNIKVHTGEHERGIGSFRYGGKTGTGAFWRAYYKQDEHQPFDTYTYNSTFFDTTAAESSYFTPSKADDLYSYDDSFRREQGGFRYDSDKGDDSYTVQGDFYNIDRGDSFPYATYTIQAQVPAGALGNAASIDLGSLPAGEAARTNSWGWNTIARWTHKVSETESTQLQAYYDTNTVNYRSTNAAVGFKMNTIDLDFQHNFTKWGGHKFVWGADFRLSNIDSATDTFSLTLNPRKTNDKTLNGFIQDSFPVFGKRTEMTIGTKIERNDYTGEELQPSARLTFKPNKTNIIWTAVSKAVRTPVVMDHNVSIVVGGVIIPANSFGAGNPPIDMWVPARLIGNTGVREEEVVAYELGYRTTPSSRLSVDVSLFTHRGHHMMRNELISNTPPDMPVIKLESVGTSRYSGGEVSANWLVSDRWRLAAGYVYHESDEKGTTEINVGRETPKNQAQLRSYYDLGKHFEFDSALYYSDNINKGAIPRSFKLDAGLTWKSAGNDMTVSIWGLNLAGTKHRETAPDGYTSLGAAEIERSVLLQLGWKR